MATSAAMSNTIVIVMGCDAALQHSSTTDSRQTVEQLYSLMVSHSGHWDGGGCEVGSIHCVVVAVGQLVVSGTHLLVVVIHVVSSIEMVVVMVVGSGI